MPAQDAGPHLTKEQDEQRLRGLRALARLIVRHHLAVTAGRRRPAAARGRERRGRRTAVPSKTARSTVEVKPRAIWERQARLNLSQKGLARLLGITSGHLSLVLNGRRRPSAALRERMLRVLRASFDDLFYVVHPDE